MINTERRQHSLIHKYLEITGELWIAFCLYFIRQLTVITGSHCTNKTKQDHILWASQYIPQSHDQRTDVCTTTGIIDSTHTHSPLVSVTCHCIAQLLRRINTTTKKEIASGHFTNEFSSAIQIIWKPSFCSPTTAYLAWHAQSFVASWKSRTELITTILIRSH